MVTHTNAKGRRFTLCELRTKTGKPRYVFAREPLGTPVEAIPDGFEIAESLNGVVSLRKRVPSPIADGELAAVRAAIAAHAHLDGYKAEIAKATIVIREPVGGTLRDRAELARDLGDGPGVSRFLAGYKPNVRYEPMLRFTLDDPVRRTFVAERFCSRGAGFWLFLGIPGKLEKHLRAYVRHLGKDSFYELM